jgi:hypothetical protein
MTDLGPQHLVELDQSAQALRDQADALEASAHALEHAAELMRVQSEVSARAIATLRGPSRLAKRVGGIEPEERS